jgi:hypothetical protein
MVDCYRDDSVMQQVGVALCDGLTPQRAATSGSPGAVGPIPATWFRCVQRSERWVMDACFSLTTF